METIVIHVDDEQAKAWNNCSPELRAMYLVKIIAILKQLQEETTSGLKPDVKRNH
jgi:hypothetical protein